EHVAEAGLLAPQPGERIAVEGERLGEAAGARPGRKDERHVCRRTRRGPSGSADAP
ncbi:MAG: hypothetical protein JWQ18_1092, partial [Conexibacter sp.]|nr:hypothetical protein [Conexibacter sp.]